MSFGDRSSVLRVVNMICASSMEDIVFSAAVLKCGELIRKWCRGKGGQDVCWLAQTLLENKAGAVTTPIAREAERDDDETTDDSHFTVRGCKGNACSHA